jgi:D-beta-D-heptose 7-phosphate kinase/D-beta-D-heptose 1-phosphate adenosyltransferase
VNRQQYEQIVRSFEGRRIIVLGDLMMDEYLWGRATRISPESPVMVVEVDRETGVPGGAANVVNNLLALGAQVAVIGVVGEDATGSALVAALEAEGADVSGIVTDPSRPTTRKTRVVAHNQQVLRIDREQAKSVSDTVARKLLANLSQHLDSHAGSTGKVEAVLVSDYNKGVLTSQVARAIVQTVREADTLLTANPKPPNVPFLSGANVVMLNQSEAEATAAIAAGLGGAPWRFDDEDRLDDAGAALRRSLGVETLVITRGSKGLSLWHAWGGARHIPAHPVEVYDVAGAGDTVISVLTLGLAAGAPIEDAAFVANHAGACVVRKVGVATVTIQELLADWQDDDTFLHY